MKTNFELMSEVFTNNSYEIFQFLRRGEINKLRNVHRFFNNLCECNELFEGSIEALDELFYTENNNKKIVIDCNKKNKKQSKFLERFNFNKPLDKYYKNTQLYNQRIESAKKSRKNN